MATKQTVYLVDGEWVDGNGKPAEAPASTRKGKATTPDGKGKPADTGDEGDGKEGE